MKNQVAVLKRFAEMRCLSFHGRRRHPKTVVEVHGEAPLVDATRPHQLVACRTVTVAWPFFSDETV
jgi:hypothetical protein